MGCCQDLGETGAPGRLEQRHLCYTVLSLAAVQRRTTIQGPKEGDGSGGPCRHPGKRSRLPGLGCGGVDYSEIILNIGPAGFAMGYVPVNYRGLTNQSPKAS